MAVLTGAAATAQQTVIRMMAGPSFGIPPKESTTPRDLTRRAVFDEFHKRHPDIRVVNAGGLELTGDKADSNFLMSMAGDTAPDVFYVNFRQYFSYIEQGFCLPLTGLEKQDPETTARIQPEITKVLRSYDGQLYAIPFYQVAQALYFRKDHFREAGLDPAKPPRTWDEFYEAGQRLCESAPGRSGFVFSASPGGKAYWWTNFVWQAGGDVLVPADRGYSRSVVDSPEAAKALDFFRKLTVDKWQDANGKDQGPVAKVSAQWNQEVREGKISMWFAYTNDVMLSISDLNPSLVGIAAMPAGPAGSKNEFNAGMWAINASVRDPEKLRACWEFVKYFASEEAARVQTDSLVDQGLHQLVNPALLRKFGHAELASLVDPAYLAANEKLFSSGKPEPYGRNSQQVYVVLDSALDRAMLEKTPSTTILKEVQAEMNAKLLGYIPVREMAMKRTAGWTVLALLCIGMAGLAIRQALRRVRAPKVKSAVRPDSDRAKKQRFVLACLLPAVALIFVWSYYPLFRGLAIAFQDYRIMQPTRWVGVDNFVEVATQPVFWKSMLNSLLYVVLTVVIGFLMPIVLALSLNEIPRFQVFFRTLFYLPAMTSGIVVAFMWRQFYDKAPEGLLNQMVGPLAPFLNPVLGVIGGPQLGPANDWLGNPQLALLAVVLPGIWAGAGPGSILYLAALKNVPEERYEAADLDGANWVHKIRHITMPGLKALVLINFLGVVIGGFKAMDNVFVLTGGGPLYATHTVGLEVWTNAFMFLKFGYATAAAWVLGSVLIGFTVMQVKHLTKMKFSAAKAN